MISFFVPGKPIAQGRISTINGHSFHSNAKELLPWRDTIAWYARAARIPIMDFPVEGIYEFFFEKPKTVKREFPAVKPDLDHLDRAVNDALSRVLFKDDGMVIRCTSWKLYAETPGVKITLGAYPMTSLTYL